MNRTLTFRPAWTPFMVILMILGFVVFWPLGLAILAYILWGDRLQGTDYGDAFRRNVDGLKREFGGAFGGPASGNAAFDDYRERELRRLDEERRRLEDERREFDAFVRNLRRARDQEEFDRFMADRRNLKTTEPGNGDAGFAGATAR